MSQEILTHAFAGPRPGPAWQQREEGWARFQSTGFPSGKEEMWLGYDKSLVPTGPGSEGTGSGADAPILPDTTRIVVAAGVLDEDASDPVPEGVRILAMEDLDDEVAHYHYDSCAVPDPFTDLNTAMWHGGLLIDVLPGTRLERPLHIIHVTEGGTSFPRVLVHVQKDAVASIIEQNVGGGHSIAVTELALHAAATLTHVRWDAGTGRTVHGVFARQERDSRLVQGCIDVGGISTRTTTNTLLAEPGATCHIAGLSLSRGEQRVDSWTRVDHAVANTRSEERYHVVLDGKSRSRFTGNVLVRKGADGTDAVQENRNLLLSREALAESTPQLEIHADDVKCSHGSTTGRIDRDALFFLRARGIGADDARIMLTKAFAQQALDVFDGTVAKVLDRIVDDWFEVDA